MSNLEGLPDYKATSHTEAVESSKKSKTNKVPTTTQKTIQTASKAVSGEIINTDDRAKMIDAVLELMERGESERSACRIVGINRATFRNSALKHKAASQYANALFGMAQAQVEQIEKTIEDMRSGEIDAAQARVEIDTRKWLSSKFLPKTYGDKLDVTSDGEKVVPILGVIAAQPKQLNESEDNELPS